MTKNEKIAREFGNWCWGKNILADCENLEKLMLRFLNERTRQYKIGKIFWCHIGNGTWWFRLFGVGVHYRNITKHSFTFSERYHYSSYLKIGNWVFKWLGK